MATTEWGAMGIRLVYKTLERSLSSGRLELALRLCGEGKNPDGVGTLYDFCIASWWVALAAHQG
eukprot:4057602-Amphidinium_carterae.1